MCVPRVRNPFGSPEEVYKEDFQGYVHWLGTNLVKPAV